jgi:nucleotide-binding universal stress UspA family protein
VDLFRTILVATDFSEHSDQALQYAAELGEHTGGTLHLIHAIGVATGGVQEMGIAYTSLMIETLTKEAQAALDARAAKYRERVAIAPVRLEVGDARDAIVRTAAQIDADLIVMGTHGRRGIRRALLGSVAESVVRTAPCPVLTIRPKRE